MTAAHATTLCALLGCQPERLMDVLQTEQAGLVSDLCVTADDVPDSDADRAIATLRAAALKEQGQRELF